MTNWISVEERLPNLTRLDDGNMSGPSKIVAIFVPNNRRMLVGYLTCYGWREHYGTSCDCCAAESCDPTHWMPLPEPPNG